MAKSGNSKGFSGLCEAIPLSLHFPLSPSHFTSCVGDCAGKALKVFVEEDEEGASVHLLRVSVMDNFM